MKELNLAPRLMAILEQEYLDHVVVSTDHRTGNVQVGEMIRVTKTGAAPRPLVPGSWDTWINLSPGAPPYKKAAPMKTEDRHRLRRVAHVRRRLQGKLLPRPPHGLASNRIGDRWECRDWQELPYVWGPNGRRNSGARR